MRLTATINDIETSLYLAQKLERMGRHDEAEWPTWVVPYQSQPDRQQALDLFQNIVDRLRARDVDVVVTTRSAPNGQVFMLTLPETHPPAV
jgi:hypothetical protein